VQGDIATLQELDFTPALRKLMMPAPGDSRHLQSGQAEIPSETASERLERVAGWELSQVGVAPQATISVGPPLRVGQLWERPQLESSDAEAWAYGVREPSAVPTVNVTDPGNRLDGDAFLPIQLPAQPYFSVPPPLSVGAGNLHHGEVRRDSFAQGLTPERNPLRDVKTPRGLDDFEVVVLPPPTVDWLPMAARDQQWISGTVELNPTAYGGRNRFILRGNSGNRYITPARTIGTYGVIETRGKLKLTNCMLYVDGNLDLSSALGAGTDAVGIEGTNATLVVNGTLLLAGGRLDSRDQGMVIWAKNIITRASGDYRGLIISQDAISIMPQPGSADGLSIRGAVLCNRNLILSSVNLTYDPVYLKSLHNYGDAVPTAWREIP
jgi:hypothetical protein